MVRDSLAVLLVFFIGSAEEIPVEYHCGGSPEPHLADVRKQGEPGELAEVLSDEEVTVPPDEELPRAAQTLQLPGDALREVGALVIPDPGLEEVAEDIELVAPQALLAEEPDESLGNVGAAVLKMEIPDEYPPHTGMSPISLSVTFHWPYESVPEA